MALGDSLPPKKLAIKTLSIWTLLATNDAQATFEASDSDAELPRAAGHYPTKATSRSRIEISRAHETSDAPGDIDAASFFRYTHRYNHRDEARHAPRQRACTRRHEPLERRHGRLLLPLARVLPAGLPREHPRRPYYTRRRYRSPTSPTRTYSFPGQQNKG